MERFDMVLVVWRDIHGEGGWTPTKKANKIPTVTCYTLGYWLSERKGTVRVASTKQRNGKKTVGDVTSLPSGCVVGIFPVSVVRD